MKIAEALLQRGAAQKKLLSLKERISRNVLVQEGAPAAEDVAELLRQSEHVCAELEKLLSSINSANLSTKMPDGRTLTAGLARRDVILQHVSLLQSAIAATNAPGRYSAREIKWVSVVNVADLQKQSDGLSAELRELNARIQETNWLTDI